MRENIRYYKFITCLICLIFCCPDFLGADQYNLLSLTDTLQTEDPVRVDSIKISGNDVTEDFIILRELTFKPGDTVTKKQLEYNRERIFSLKLFNKVELYAKAENNLSIIHIDVWETWYIYPIPFISKRNGAGNKYSYGMYLIYKNFRGRNEDIRTIVSLGYDPYFMLLYENPAFQYDENIGISFGVSFLKLSNKSQQAKILYGGDFNSNFYSVSLGLSKRLDQFNNIYFSSGFDYITFPENNIQGISASGTTIDRTLWLTAGYVYDSRDLKQFPQDGIYSNIQIQHKGFGINNISYNILRLEFQGYRNIIGNLIGRWRLAARNTFGRLVPFYDYSYLGYGEYVRGHSNDNREGNNFLLSSVELSYPLLKEWDVSLKLPLLPRKLTSARIGIYLTVFGDAGNAVNNKQKIKTGDFYSGYGFGLTLLVLPYNAVRFEYAFNELGKGEFLIGTGVAF